jgi:hypothetical protein
VAQIRLDSDRAGGGEMTKYEDIMDFNERCEKHPDHQSGMISYAMVERRLREEIEELRQYIEQRLEKKGKSE